jgi:hypothetical protein
MDKSRLRTFESRYDVILLHHLGLGPGQDGIVLQSNRRTAVKFFDQTARFYRELEVYQTLRAKGIRSIAEHNVPALILEDGELKAIEMSVVQRPFVLDFAGAKLPYEVPDFGDEIMAEHHAHLRELFDDRWTEALHVAEMFRLATGYMLLDIHPGNIAFADQ